MSEGHGPSNGTWFEFLEGTLAEPERMRVEAHLEQCQPCRTMYVRIRAWEGAVEEEARRLTGALARSPEEIERLAEESLERIRDSGWRESPGGFRFGEAVLIMRSLLDPLCGKGAARNAVQLATERSCRAGEHVVTAGNWTLFVRNLGAAIGAVYGAPARVLIEHVGDLVGAEVC